MSAPRAIVRLSRAAVHLVHGMAIVSLRFDRMNRIQREARIAWWSGKLLRLLGIELRVHGALPHDLTRCLVVANHVSWLDIAAMHAVMPAIRFVSKADVQHWPLVGSMVAGAGTLFIERERRRDAIRVVHHMVEALDTGEAVAVFPEGTTSDGTGLLPFHANLLQAAITAKARVWPVALRYTDAAGSLSQAALFVGETTLMQSAWRIAASARTVVTVQALEPIPTDGRERRGLAQDAHDAILQALNAGVAPG